MMGTHCLFVLTTLSLLLSWVRLVTAGTQWVFILTTLSLLCFVKMSIHMFYLYKQFFYLLCTSPCALFLYFQSTHPTVNACINKSQRWRCSTVCSTTVLFRFCINFTLAVEQPNNVESVYGQTYRAIWKVSDAISITHFYWCSVIVRNKLHLSCWVTVLLLFLYNERWKHSLF